MGEEYINWLCKNNGCCGLNRVKREKILAPMKEGKIVTLVCGNCGFVNDLETSRGVQTEGNNSWLPCISFESTDRRLPSGSAGGLYKDSTGRSLSRLDFIKINRIDPEIFLKWKMRGYPKAKD